MTQTILVGIVAGLAAALLFLAPLGGGSFVVPLFALTGLPIALAGFGWSAVAAAVAAGAGALALAAVMSPVAGLSFLFLIGAPVVWVARLAGLSRQVAAGEPDSPIEWYPLGRMLFHLALAVAVGVVATGIVIGFDVEAFSKALTEALVAFFSASPEVVTPPSADDVAPFVRLNVAAMPLTVPMITTVFLVFDMWLAARIARMSGRMTRAPERLWTAELPPMAIFILGAAIVLAFLPYPLGAVATAVAGALGTAAALVGLAVLHALTLGNSARWLILVVAYALLFLLGFPILLFALLGAADTFLHLRARRFGAVPPAT